MHFEKVSFEAFKRDVHDYYGGMPDDEIKEIYDNIVLPERKTKYSAAYDVATPLSVLILPGQSMVIPTGIKAVFAEEEMETWCLKLYARSSIGIKDRVIVTNAVGIIDSDYQFAENDGDMMLALTNIGSTEKMYRPGHRICQAIFEIHGITSDDAAFGARTGGLGSTSAR